MRIGGRWRARACGRARFRPVRRRGSRTDGRGLRIRSRVPPRCTSSSGPSAWRCAPCARSSVRSGRAGAPGRPVSPVEPRSGPWCARSPQRRSRPRRPPRTPRSTAGKRRRITAPPRARRRRRRIPRPAATDAALIGRDRRHGVDPELGEVLLAFQRLTEGDEAACTGGDPIQDRAPALGRRDSPRPPLIARSLSIGPPRRPRRHRPGR